MRKIRYALFLITISYYPSSIVLAEGQVQFCAVFPDGRIGNCSDTLYNCEVGNSNKHMGAKCVPMPK